MLGASSSVVATISARPSSMNHGVKYVGLEELAVLVVWGHLMIEGGYYTITGEWI